MTLLQRLCSLFHQHDFIRKRTAQRLYLECAQCGLKTPGWDLTGSKWNPEEIDEIHQDFLKSELSLIGGG